MYIPVFSFDLTVGLSVGINLIISEMFKTLRVYFNSFSYAESELNLVNITRKSGQHIANKGGNFRRLWRNHFFAWSTWPEKLVNKLGYLPNTFCTHNVQNMSKKNRGKNLFSKSLPRISLIISIFQVIPLQQPARQPNVR